MAHQRRTLLRPAGPGRFAAVVVIVVLGRQVGAVVRPLQPFCRRPWVLGLNDFSGVPHFGAITATISNYAAGRGTPRELQLSAKITF